MYDFHKIRNDNNKNIFEHKEFKRDQKYLLILSPGNPSKILNVKDATEKEINKVNKTSVFPIMTIWHSISKKPPGTKKNTIRQSKAIIEINKNLQCLPLKSYTLS